MSYCYCFPYHSNSILCLILLIFISPKIIFQTFKIFLFPYLYFILKSSLFFQNLITFSFLTFSHNSSICLSLLLYFCFSLLSKLYFYIRVYASIFLFFFIQSYSTLFSPFDSFDLPWSLAYHIYSLCWIHRDLRASTTDSAYSTSVRRWFTATVSRTNPTNLEGPPTPWWE